jgi:hypothetical protein
VGKVGKVGVGSNSFGVRSRRGVALEKGLDLEAFYPIRERACDGVTKVTSCLIGYSI